MIKVQSRILGSQHLNLFFFPFFLLSLSGTTIYPVGQADNVGTSIYVPPFLTLIISPSLFPLYGKCIHFTPSPFLTGSSSSHALISYRAFPCSLTVSTSPQFSVLSPSKFISVSGTLTLPSPLPKVIFRHHTYLLYFSGLRLSDNSDLLKYLICKVPLTIITLLVVRV